MFKVLSIFAVAAQASELPTFGQNPDKFMPDVEMLVDDAVNFIEEMHPVYAPAETGSEICVTNMAGFVLHWDMTDLLTGKTSGESAGYPADNVKCMKIAESLADIKEGDLVLAHVHAVAGVTHQVDTPIIYTASPEKTVTFSCKGTTL